VHGQDPVGNTVRGKGRAVLFRVFSKSELRSLFDRLAAGNTVYGPVRKASFDDLALDYTSTSISAKRFFLPFHEDLATYRLDGADWTREVDYHMDRPAVFFGLHACDINALNRLDKVLMGSEYPVPFYAAKRRNIFIIGVNCQPQPSCFCRSMGTDTAMHGFDLFLTDIGDKYFAETLSSEAYHLLKNIKTAEPAEADHERFVHAAAEKNRRFTASVDITDLCKILDMEFQSPVWKAWGDKCLGCGSCASVCPTCYCYGVEETVDPGLRVARKTRSLYSCTIVDFAEVAGGHNFRPDRGTRLKYRYYHKHRGFVEAYEESLCVGCGRCGDVCLAGITVPEVIASVRGEEK
jgi:sulfhydrogenase subunit beta (sulfur reductase)